MHEHPDVFALDVRFDPRGQCAQLGSFRAYFTGTGYALFAYLAAQPGRWAHAEELRQHVLRTYYAPGASNLRWHVLQVREALGPLRWCLHGARHRGYMFDLHRCGVAHCTRAVGNARVLPAVAQTADPRIDMQP